MTLIHITVFIVSLLGFGALAMPRHYQPVKSTALSKSRINMLRVTGWSLLTMALILGLGGWTYSIGIVTWLGWLTVAGLALVFFLASGGAPSKIRMQSRQPTAAPETTYAASANASHRFTGLAAILLLAPLTAFAWQLLSSSQKPLLREDAVTGKIGPWSFTLAEKDRKSPELVAMDIPLKTFVIRFCDGCDANIRMAYLKIREPHLLRAAGNGFKGRGREKSVEIPVPAAANLDDDIWLTVEGNDGEIYQQAFDIRQLSPALSTFLRERS